MSVVVVREHDRMASQYKRVCKNYKCKTKIFTQMSTSLDKQIGKPDLLVLSANTVSHKMICCVLGEVESGMEIVRCHISSDIALIKIFEERCAVCTG